MEAIGVNALAWTIIALVVLDGIAVYACLRVASDVDDSVESGRRENWHPDDAGWEDARRHDAR